MFSPSFSRFSRALSTSAARLGDIQVTEAAPYVYHVKLSRPKKRNTFTLDMWKESSKVFSELSLNPKCRSIVLSGEGKSFCAGIDIQEGMGELMELMSSDKLDGARKARFLSEFIREAAAGYTAIAKCYKPVIAAIHSHCIGAGVDLVTACDIRFAAKDSIFSIREVNVGLAADVGTLARIQKIVANDSLTRELAYSGRDIGADEALNYGLVSRVLPHQEATVEAAIELAKEIASKSPIAVQGTKVNLNYGRDHTIDDSLEYVRVWNMSQLNTEDLMKSGLALMTKEKAEFNDV